MSRNIPWNSSVVAASLFGALIFMPLEVHAEKIKTVSGLMGAQDSRSKELLALSPAEANQVATRDLISLLMPTGKFTLDNSRNVEGMVFTTRPYWTTYRYVCREDRVTLKYKLRFGSASSEDQRGPVGVEAQPTYHIEQLPVPGFVPGTSYKITDCDAAHLDSSATWFSAPSNRDAVRAANMFRMAVDEVKAGRLTPSPCDTHAALTCSQWLLSLDDPSKIVSVEPCATDHDDEVCYAISFDSVDVTITGKISHDDMEAITPAAITSIRVDNVIMLMP